jgi:periplasmic divalent cation tolerance protein
MYENKYAVVITTCENLEQADLIIHDLLDKKLAACIQTQNVKSFYTWKGKVEVSEEILLFIKAKFDLFGKIRDSIKSNHSYEIAEIIQLPISNGLVSYLNWVDEVCEK